MSLPRVAVWMAEIDPVHNSSPGIVNFTLQVMRRLVQEPQGREWILVVSQANAAWMRAQLPPQARFHVLPGDWSHGWMRIVADQLLQPLVARFLKVDALLLPKGYASVLQWLAPPTWSVLHDAIVVHYCRHPQWRRLGHRYFAWLTRVTLKLSHRILTVSEYSRGELLALAPGAEIIVLPEGTGLAVCEAKPRALGERRGILVLGSRMPHKETERILRLLVRQPLARREPILVTSLSAWPAQWGEALEGDVRFLGRVSDAKLDELYAHARVFVFPCAIEGFGLPALEAVERLCPLVWRDAGGIGETMRGFSGGWDGRDETLEAALDQALEQTEEGLEAKRQELLTRYNWDATARALVGSL